MAEARALQTGPTIVDVFVALRRWWWVLLVCIVGVTGAAIAVALTMPPLYSSAALLAPSDINEQGNQSPGPLAALSGLVGEGSGGRSAEAIAILKSRRFTEQFIERHQLLPILLAEEQGPRAGRLKDDEPSLEDAVLRFSNDVVSVEADNETGFVSLKVEWYSADVAQQWVNALVRDLNAEMRTRASREAQADLNFLQARLAQANVPEMRQMVAELVRDRMITVMLASNRPNYAFKIIDPGARSKYRSQPQRTLMAIGGAAAGLLLGLALIAILETVRRLRVER